MASSWVELARITTAPQYSDDRPWHPSEFYKDDPKPSVDEAGLTFEQKENLRKNNPEGYRLLYGGIKYGWGHYK